MVVSMQEKVENSWIENLSCDIISSRMPRLYNIYIYIYIYMIAET